VYTARTGPGRPSRSRSRSIVIALPAASTTAVNAARRKRYRYLIRDTKERGLFDRLFAWHVRYPLDDDRLMAKFHDLVEPVEETVPDRSAFGTHWGLLFFFGDDPIKMRDLLKAQEELDFYV
jgi:hypothetical protein